MSDTGIQDFLNERKSAWLKNKIKSNTTDVDKAALEQQALDEFSLPTWLASAANRAKQLSIVSHPGKFSHPGAKISSFIATATRLSDGFLRTGNVEAGLDVFGNAAAMDVYKFLNIKLSDDKTILAHLEKKSPLIEKQLTIPNVPFAEIAQGLLAIKEDTGVASMTSGKVKQVYFPIGNGDYHLLSILSPSSILFKLKERINVMRFSDEAKEVREARRRNKPHDLGLSEVYGLSAIGFGGTKPQNISVLNSQNGGVAYLLPSMPPQLSSRSIQPPRKNFFSNTLWIKNFQDDFLQLQKLLQDDHNNIHIRRKRDKINRHIIYKIIDQLWRIRHIESGWSDSDNYQTLPQYQKVWLDQQYAVSRENDESWLQPVKDELARWFLNTSQKLIKDKRISLGDEHMHYFNSIIDKCEEALR